MEAIMRYLDPRAVAIGVGVAIASIVVGVPTPLAVMFGIVVTAIADFGHVVRAVAEPHRSPQELDDTREPAVLPPHPDEMQWLRQADGAVEAIRQGAASLDGGPLRRRLDGVADDAAGVRQELARLATQVSASRLASERIDLPKLTTDLDRLTATLGQVGDPDMVRDLQRSIEAVREQLRIGRRLTAIRAGLQTRIEAGTLGLQRLAAQVGEMAALAPPGGGAWEHAELIDELTMQLDALRAGLGDAAAASSRALGALGTEGGSDVAVVP
jgi:hypothetical protein